MVKFLHLPIKLTKGYLWEEVFWLLFEVMLNTDEVVMVEVECRTAFLGTDYASKPLEICLYV